MRNDSFLVLWGTLSLQVEIDSSHVMYGGFELSQVIGGDQGYYHYTMRPINLSKRRECPSRLRGQGLSLLHSEELLRPALDLI